MYHRNIVELAFVKQKRFAKYIDILNIYLYTNIMACVYQNVFHYNFESSIHMKILWL